MTNTFNDIDLNEYDVRLDLTLSENYIDFNILNHAFMNCKLIIVLYNDLNELKLFLRKFLIVSGGGISYKHELDDIIEMNLGLKN